MSDNENPTELNNNEQKKNDEAWNKIDFAILGSVFILFLIGMFIALHMDLIVMEVKDNMRFHKQKIEQQKALEAENEAPVDFTKNMKEITKKIKKNWNPPKVLPQKSTVVEFGINKKGVVTATAVSESCGDPNIDKLAVEAIEKSSPFKPLPKNFKGDGVRIHFKFDFEPSFKEQTN